MQTPQAETLGQPSGVYSPNANVSIGSGHGEILKTEIFGFISTPSGLHGPVEHCLGWSFGKG